MLLHTLVTVNTYNAYTSKYTFNPCVAFMFLLLSHVCGSSGAIKPLFGYKNKYRHKNACETLYRC